MPAETNYSMKGGWCLPPNIESRVWVKFETQATTKELVLAYWPQILFILETSQVWPIPTWPSNFQLFQKLSEFRSSSRCPRSDEKLSSHWLARMKWDNPLLHKFPMWDFRFFGCQIRFLQSIPDTSQYRGEGAQGDSTGSPRFPEVPEFSAGSIHPQSPRRQRNMGDANWEAAQSRLGWESPGTMYPGWSEHAYPTQNWLRFHGPWPVALMLYNMWYIIYIIHNI